MSTLYVFGDSYTQGHHQLETYPAYKQFKEFRGGELFELWSELLANKLGMGLENHGWAGACNEQVFSRVCNHCYKFKKGDIVIVNWTYPTRFPWANEKWNEYMTIHGGPMDIITEHTRKEILINRFHSRYVKTLYEYEKIIDKLAEAIGFDIYFWSADNTIIYNLPSKKKNKRKYIINDLIANGETLFYEIFRRGGKTIQEESNKTIEDTHLGESGHKIQAELFYSYITNTEYPNHQYMDLNYFQNPHLAKHNDPVRINKHELTTDFVQPKSKWKIL
jgi:hypothetical protein